MGAKQVNKLFNHRSIWQCLGLAVILLAPGVGTAVPLAELVSVRTEDRVLLHGLLYSPAEDSDTVVIHIPGGPGSFYSMQDMAPLAEALNEAGHHFLSMNTRTAGANGLMYARFDDYVKDVQAAVDLAKQRGLDDIALLGHSLGSARVIYYLSRTGDDSVEALVLSGVITSPYQEAQLRWDEKQRAAFDAFLAEQRVKIEAGDGRELSAYPWWGPGRPPLEISAASWVDMFGTPRESNASTTKFAADVTVPVLIAHGTADEVARPENAEKLLAALTNSPDKELIWIEGGDHMLVGHADEYARLVTEWLQQYLGD